MKIKSFAFRYVSNDGAHVYNSPYVYVLWCPLAKQIKYVGYSSQVPRQRFLRHLSEARTVSNHHRAKSKWIYDLLQQGHYPRLRVVRYFDSICNALVCEAALIESIGVRRELLNSSKGEFGLIAFYKSQQS